MPITDEFLEWLKTAPGKELMSYVPKDDTEKSLVEDELDKRVDHNTQKIVDSVWKFLNNLGKE